MKKQSKLLLFSLAGGALLAGVFLAGLLTGPVPLSTGEVLSIITGHDHPQAWLITHLRLPRIGLAMVSGALLTLGGFVMQALVRNPLADPYLMGLSAGAGFGANVYLLGWITLGITSILVLPAFAFAGACLSLLLLLALGLRSLQGDPVRLLLAGVALSSVFTALTGLLIFLKPGDNQLRNALIWTMGSFNGASLTGLGIATALLLVYAAIILLLAPRLDVMSLGDARARSLGLDLARTRLILLLLSALCIGGTIAFTGPIGFVGMMVPHFSRAALGHSHARCMPIGAAFGAAYLGFCDVLSQWIHPPAGLPVGLITAVLGVPFFIYLLMNKSTAPR